MLVPPEGVVVSGLSSHVVVGLFVFVCLFGLLLNEALNSFTFLTYGHKYE
jgi:hypothetical protein